MNEIQCTLSFETLKKFRENLESDPKNRLALNACSKTDPLEVCLQRKIIDSAHHVYTNKVDAETKPVTNQKSTGRCWLFAALNVMRIPFVKHLQLEEFEFSQNYLFYWDKIERSHYFLRTITDVLKKGESIDGRLVSFLLSDPVADGGQWDMLVNIINKYGVVPKKCFPDTFCSETSARLNGMLKAKVREYTKDLNELISSKANDEKIDNKILVCMEELYRIISICLGVPPETFTWEYYNKTKAYGSVGPITPQKFYEEYVKPHCDLDNKVCLVNDPRPDNPFNRTYSVDCLGNMVGGRRTIYVNRPIQDLAAYAAESIKNNESVWFGCDVGKRYNLKTALQDLNLHDYKNMFGVDVNLGLSKAERLLYGDSCMTHAMVFTAVSLDSDGKPLKWRVENSWGDERGEKGFLMMTSDWFEQFVFEVVLDKQYIPKEVLDLQQLEPKVLPAWDPMGALAA